MELHTLPSYEEILEHLDAYHNLERAGVLPGSLNGGSERMARLMQRLGSPHTAIPAVHVAGTKGKGSVTHMVAAALAASGIKTGLYTSPHVDDLRERIAVNGRPVSRERFIESAAVVMHEADAMRRDGASPSWFEALTATAFVAFRAEGVEAMVLETGLGGRLDATNLPDLRLVAAGLTAISKDHEDILGDTLAAIAGEKAAIIKPHIPTVTMRQEDGVMRVIAARARELAAPLLTVGRDIQVQFRKTAQPDKPNLGQRLDLETRRNVYPDIPLAMLGRHQADNAALALGLADLLLEYMDREPLDSLVLKRAWRGLTLPARMEVMDSRPWLVVDGAHNPASAWAAAETVTESFRTAERTMIFGVARDKDSRAMLRILAPLFKRVVFTGFDSPRATPAAELERFLRESFPDVKPFVAPGPADALATALRRTPPDGLILCTGSLWLAGEIRALRRSGKVAQS